MGSTVNGSDVVGEAEDLLLVAVVVLQGDFHCDFVQDLAVLLQFANALQADGAVQRFAAAVKVLDIGCQASLFVELPFLAGALVVEEKPHLWVKERQLVQALLDAVGIPLGRLKNFRVGHESDGRSRSGGFADGLEAGDRFAPFVTLIPDFAVSLHPHFQPLGKGVNDTDADAVQAP